MKKSLIKIILLFCLFLNQDVKAQTGFYIPQLANFDTAMLNLMNQYDVPGGELAITYHGRLVYNRGFGYADTTTHTPLCPDNVFRLASLSKQITSITIMHLYEQGRIHLNDTVFGANGILNDITYQNIIDPLVYHITVRELLTHSGGWNRDISGDPMFNSYAIATAMSAAPPANSVTVIQYVLSHQMLDFSPGTQYQYSNFGYCVLGRVIEKITGQNYGNYVRDTILIPLNITDMFTGFNLLSQQLPKEVNYYDYSGAPYAYSVYDNVTLVPWPYGGFNIEAMDSHGAWVASAQDLCKLLVAIDGFPTKLDILLPATIDTMVYPSSTNVNYALGWQVNSYHNWWHTGSLPGITTEIVRGNNQLNWAILLNTRPSDSGPITTDVDNLVWNVLPTITSWPLFDLFDSTYNCLTTSVKNTYETQSSLNIYPNPFSTETIIQTDKLFTNAILTVYNSFGQKVKQIKNISGQAVILSRDNLPNGLYFIRLIQDSKVIATKKILITD